MQFFPECTTIDEVKAQYKILAKIHHPDKGGDVATMQALNNEYSFAIAKIARGADFTDAEISNIITENEKYREAIAAIINIEGINIELVGSWIWVTNTRKEIAKQLKDAGFFWANKKIAWYFRTAEFSCKGCKKNQSLDDIKNKYGTTTIKNNFKPALN